MKPSDQLLGHFGTLERFQAKVRHYRGMCIITPPWPELNRSYIAHVFGTHSVSTPWADEERAELLAFLEGL